MTERLVRVDDALIDGLFQPWVNWLGDRTALDRFRVARICIDLAALAWILSQSGNTAKSAAAGNWGLEAFQFAIISLGLGALTILRAVFQRTGGGLNPLRPGMQVHRFACLFWLIGLFAKTSVSAVASDSLALLAIGIFVTLGVYVGACSTPPRKRRESPMTGWSWKLEAPARR